MLKNCLNPKVLVGLIGLGGGLFLVAPNLALAAAPFLLMAACPLSMLLMGRMSMVQGQHASDVADGTYTCPMHTDVKSDEPGRCPTCGMALVGSPVKKAAAAIARQDALSVEEVQARLEMVAAEKAALTQELERLTHVQAQPAQPFLEEAERILREAEKKP